MARYARLVGLLSAMALLGATPTAAPGQGGALPLPELELDDAYTYSTPGGTFTRLVFEVKNRATYPPELFAPAPQLPPCGANSQSSRTWVDFFSGEGRRLYGFCALSGPSQLDSIWVAVKDGEAPPSAVYVELRDRQSSKLYRSNNVAITPAAMMEIARKKRAAAKGFRIAERAIAFHRASGKSVDEAWYRAAIAIGLVASPPK